MSSRNRKKSNNTGPEMQLTWMNHILFAEASSGLNVRMTHIGSMAAKTLVFSQ